MKKQINIWINVNAETTELQQSLNTCRKQRTKACMTMIDFTTSAARRIFRIKLSLEAIKIKAEFKIKVTL